ncbi:DNA cytosine methyltransferase [Pseudonocardia zijingensis]|uniref:DNA (cytosine-5-)-methyltransferase n=1 Tax=Pseudonocardia zijingensis TaxID=153376 RepID=A0ABN1N905_9PSEU
MTTSYELDRAGDRRLPAAYAWSVHAPNGLRYHDWFCGAGGSSLGMTAAGMELAIAANHWQRAIETHSANFPDAEHLCADLTHYDLRLAPPAEVLWASPICTEASPAGGRRRQRAQGELELFGPVAKEGMERTRATFWEVIRSTELFRYQAVIVENVVDVATEWGLFDYWLEGMRVLGYAVQFVSVSSAHIGGPTNPHAPQWRDRLYMVFTRQGAPLPDVDPRPLAWCEECGEDVHAIQSWKRPGRRIGKYRQQYVYRCPRRECRHAVVEPYVLPAAAAIDWSNLGTRVGDRARPLAAKTRARIEAGLRMFAQPVTAVDAPLTARTTTSTKGVAVPPVMVSVNHGGADGRAYPAHTGPLPARTVRIGDGMACPPMTVPAGGTWRDEASPVDMPMGARTTRDTDALVVPPFVAELRGGGSVARPVLDPLATVTAGGRHHGLTVPPEVAQAFYVKNHGGYAQPRDTVRSVGEPLGAITVKDPTSLVIPFRRGARPHGTDDTALSTVATREQHGLAHLGFDVDDCLFRMLTPEEHLAAQRFHPSYVVLGNQGERTMQAGNAVSSNVAQWLGAAVAAALCGDSSSSAAS